MFNSAAGGGEAYTYIQFTMDAPSFEKFMAESGFVAQPASDPEFSHFDVNNYSKGEHFRYSLPFIARPVFYHKPGAPAHDNPSVLWDPDRRVAHAKRIQG
jgi:hypothetical protein